MITSFNPIGTRTLYIKEVRRFMKVYNQTLLAPVITALLFLAVFNLAVGKRIPHVEGVPFGEFMASGLIMMSLMQNAFANTSSSFTMGKVLGSIIDYLMPPISSAEITFAMVMASVTRGVIVGILVGISVYFFVPFHIYNWGYTLFYLLSASVLMSLLGLLAGILSETFDHMAAITSYVITPLSFLSGTFYSVKNLPPFWHNVSQYNPFFYMIDGFRYGMTGYHDSHLHTGLIYIVAITTLLWMCVQTMLTRGYRIKS